MVLLFPAHILPMAKQCRDELFILDTCSGKGRCDTPGKMVLGVVLAFVPELTPVVTLAKWE